MPPFWFDSGRERLILFERDLSSQKSPHPIHQCDSLILLTPGLPVLVTLTQAGPWRDSILSVLRLGPQSSGLKVSHPLVSRPPLLLSPLRLGLDPDGPRLSLALASQLGECGISLLHKGPAALGEVGLELGESSSTVGSIPAYLVHANITSQT